MACTQDNTRYSVQGTAPEDGRTVYLLDMITNEPINSTVVSGGTFQMKGKAARDAYLSVNFDNDDWWFLFFNDGVPVQVDGEECFNELLASGAPFTKHPYVIELKRRMK